MTIQQIAWTSENTVRYLDQTVLPQREVYREAATVDDMIRAIQTLQVRGAPLIGVAASLGLVAAAYGLAASEITPGWVDREAERLGRSRPTAVNLMWAMSRMRETAARAFQDGKAGAEVVAELRREAQAIWDEDQAMCRAIGEAGAVLVPERATVMTICNAGALATGGIGTALAVLYVAAEQGKDIEVLSSETRPLRQGARLTAWELQHAGIAVTSIVDGAVGAMMARGGIDLAISGADRIAANGDVANKIGTYGLAVLAHVHGIPFYVAAPRSTFDLSIESGAQIPIEERSSDEVDPAPGARVYNPAFDVTPARYVTALVTDVGLLESPYQDSISRALRREAANVD
jgi:methylthioribose-1-phosphate isomerase